MRNRHNRCGDCSCFITEEGEPYYCAAKDLYTFVKADDRANEVEPIPITPALLEELRFINTSWSGRRIVYTNGNEENNPWIEFKNLKDRWKLFVCNNGWQGQTVVRYLHEAEAFLALYGVELIKE